MRDPLRLVVLDFSGTLSPDTVLFGRDESLAAELRRSGLAALGIETPESFWTDLAGPTWEEGSLTPKGYAGVLAERLGALLAARGRREPAERIAEAAAAFTRAYFAGSPVDPAWGNLLRRLSRREDVLCLVATDHYAEATDHIVRSLFSLGVNACPARSPEPGAVLVANSADLGSPKADRTFWAALREAWDGFSFAALLVVDDFGRNEQLRDVYGEDTKVFARRDLTLRILEEVFLLPPEVFSFFLPRSALAAGGEDLRREYRNLVRRGEEFILSRVG